MNKATIHYFYDPMCGWWYGASALTETVVKLQGKIDFSFQMHAGGMIPRKEIPEHFRTHIIEADKNIAALTGAQFGEAYIAKVKNPSPLIFDSLITTQAILAWQSLNAAPVKMLKAIQTAHYIEGLDVSASSTLEALAIAIDGNHALNEQTWREAMKLVEEKLSSEIQLTRQLMAHYSVGGYPTFILTQSDKVITLNHQAYYGNSTGWHDYLLGALKEA